jgi:phage baseplate assembly protein W
MADKRVRIDLDRDFRIVDGDIATLDSFDSIAQEIKFAVLTLLGSRPMEHNRRQGSEVRSLLHSPFTKDAAFFLGDEVVSVVEGGVKNVEVNDCNVIMDMENSTYNISLVYTELTTGVSDTVNFVLRKL